MRFSFILAFFLWNQESLLRIASAGGEEQVRTRLLEMFSNDFQQMSWKDTTMFNTTDQSMDNKSQASNYHRSLTRNSNDCQLYMAESSIPHSGLGLYTAIPLKHEQIVQQPEIVLNYYDYTPKIKMLLSFSEEEKVEWSKVVEDKRDSNESCVLWAKQGECEVNPNFMLDVCAKSCAVKRAGLELDKILATQHDKHPECKSFARNGECDVNPGYMTTTCPQSCFMRKFELETKLDRMLGKKGLLASTLLLEF